MKKIENRCKNGECSRCGNCCGATTLPLTMEEAIEIASYVKRNNIIRFNREWVQPLTSGTLKPGSKIDLHCCFYDGTKQECSIYPVRPFCCREFRCDHSHRQVEEDRKLFHERAHYNNRDNKNITNFDLLFYADDIPIRVLFNHEGMRDCDFLEIFKKYGSCDTFEIK